MLYARRGTRSFVFQVAVAIMLACATASAQTAKAVSVSAPVRPAGLAGLYRVATPAMDSSSVITFLRLLPDGRSRLESLHIDTSAGIVRARVEVGAFHRNPWRTKVAAPGASPQLCFEMTKGQSCAAFHMEGSRGDLLLFAPEALWGEPTLVLRRQSGRAP
jgi:hypothetical protein